LPTYAAAAPGQIGYPIKRAEEAVVVALAPTSGLRDSLKLDFAVRRVREAAYIANQADQAGTESTIGYLLNHGLANYVYAATNSSQDEAKTAATINDLLLQFESTYKNNTEQLDQTVDQDKKISQTDAEKFRKNTVDIYTRLELLRLQAPSAAQLSVLTSIDTIQQNLAVVNDLLGKAPISVSDVSQLTKLVPAGLLSKTDVDSLLNKVSSNREFHTKLKDLVNTGKLPSDILYSLDQDVIKQVNPSQANVFEAVSEFEQMERISAVIQASRPTAAQQQDIQNYLATYKPGRQIPKNDSKRFVVPIVYGMTLAGQLQTDISSLDNVHLNSDDQALFDKWKGSLTANQQNLSQLYQQLMTGASLQPELHTRALIRMQSELVDGEKEDVTHLVLPPGWNADQLGPLSNQMAVEIAEARFIQSSPKEQESQITLTQKELQKSLETVKESQSKTLTTLKTRINNFSGTPEELTKLKESFTLLTADQTNTLTTLKSQIDGLGTAHLQLTGSIETVAKEQLIALTELELRAASNATQLTTSVKTDLSAKLVKLEQTNQQLVNAFQTKIDSLDTTQTDLQTQLTNSIETIQNNQTDIETRLQAQIDSGLAAAGQLQTTLSSVQTSITGQASQLSTLGTSTTALTTLVNQVKTTSTEQSAQLQSQIDGLKIEQQSVRDSIETLRTQQTAELNQLTGQLTTLNALQTETQVTLETLATQQTNLASDIINLSNNFTQVQSLLYDVEESQTAVQADITNQQSELTSLSTQTQAALSDLSGQLSQFTSQLGSLTATATTLSQVVTSIEQASSATQSELDTLIANPPWSIIPEGTYVTASQFDTLKTEIDSQFAQKSAELDQEFQAYQQLLHAEVQQLGQTTSSQNTTLQQEVNELRQQLETLQTQVEQLTPPTTPGL